MDNFYTLYSKKLEVKTSVKSNAFLQSFSKIDLTTAIQVVESNSNKLDKNYLNKNALEWASENKKIEVLHYLLKYYQKNNLSIQIKSNHKHFLNLNLSDINFNLDKPQHFLLCYLFQINLSRLDISVKNILVDKKDKQKNKELIDSTLNKINNQYNSNFFSLSFWENKQKIFKEILQSDFEEKNQWVDNLFIQLNIALDTPEHIETVSNNISLFFRNNLSYLPKIISLFYDKAKLTSININQQNLLINNLHNIIDRCLVSQFQSHTNTKLHYFLGELVKNKHLEVWYDYTQFLDDNHISHKNNPYLKTISDIFLYHRLKNTLNTSSPKKEKVVKI